MQKIIVLLKVVFLFCFFLLMGCRKDVSHKKVTENTDTTTVALLLQKANDFSLSKEERLKFIHQAEKELNKINQNDSLTRSYYLKLAGRYFNVQDYESYLNTSKKLYQLSIDKKDTLYTAKSLSYVGDYFYTFFESDSAFYYYSKAEKAYLLLKNNDQDLLRIKYYKANILLFEKNYYDCEAAIVTILEAAKQKNDFRLIYDCYVSLGMAQEGANEFDQSLEYFNKSLEVLNDLKTNAEYFELKAQSFNYIGRIYTKKNAFNKAILYYDLALKLDNFKEKKLSLYTNLISNKSFANLKKGNLEQSKKEIEEALKLRKKLNNVAGFVSSKIVLSEYYLQQKQLDSCIQNSMELTQLAHDNRIFEDELKGLTFLLKLAPPEKAKYAERYIKLSDSLQNAERINRNKFARIKFETKEILDQRDSIQQERDKIALQRWSILAVSTFVIAVLLLSFFAIIQHAKNKRLLLEQQQQQANEEIYKLMLTQQSVANETRKKEQKRISQELHDGIMSKLTSTRLNLFILNKKNDEETIKKCLEHVNGIQDIEKEIRSISHNLNHSSLLDQDTFETMIYDLFEKFKETTGISNHISLDSKINWNAIDNSKKINLYRILQESLQNVYKYAAATFVELDILLDEDKLKIVILDNGKGFDSSKVKAGIGLKNMNSRVESMFGKFEINSKEGDGTTIIIEIPLKNES